MNLVFVPLMCILITTFIGVFNKSINVEEWQQLNGGFSKY